jgi:hypothetical protein
MDTATQTIDERIAELNQQLDQLRNRDFVPQHQQQAYYCAIEKAEKELLSLLRMKGK